MIQSARSLKPPNPEESPEVDFAQLQMNTLRRYKKHYKVLTKPNLNKAQMSEVIFLKLISPIKCSKLLIFRYL